jgi:hypothetical protein
MSITAGSVIDKISELRSKISVFEGLVLHLKSNYIATDAGEAEMKFYRGDYAPVPEPHIHSTIGDLDAFVADLRAQLAQWEGIVIDVDETPPSGNGKKPGKKNKKEDTADATTSGHPDHPASQRARSQEDG